MSAVRRLFARHRAIAAWIVGAALLMKLLVPAGYMIGTRHGAITIELCSGHAKVAMAMPGMTDHGPKHGPGKAEQPCAFAALAAPSIAGSDPVVLAVAIAFVMMAAFRPGPVARPARPAFLRPPSRGPPATS